MRWLFHDLTVGQVVRVFHTRGFHDLEARFRGRAQRVWNSSVRRLTPEESLAVAVDREATPDFVHVTHE